MNSVYEVMYYFLQEYIFVNFDEKYINLVAILLTFIFFFSVLTAILSLLRIGGKK